MDFRTFRASYASFPDSSVPWAFLTTRRQRSCWDLSLWYHWCLTYCWYWSDSSLGRNASPKSLLRKYPNCFLFYFISVGNAATLLLESKWLGWHLTRISSGCCFSLPSLCTISDGKLLPGMVHAAMCLTLRSRKYHTDGGFWGLFK